MNPDSRQLRQQWLQLIPDPFRQVFAGRVLKTWDVIQVVMVKALVKRFENSFDFREVPDPACMRIDLASKMNADTKRMPVQTSTLMPLWNVGEKMC
ncbi:hypothetical protein NZ708_11400 [Pseudomonas syringae pv. actinidiae ICMP 18708]|nr:hypothetical protein IYO_011420 [Pseudomonas syringae pv. actinidiae ICMP 18884]AOE56569.1 hypothetical protein NZ708_11400 [Pseudomonas syringae pv. actinidiae ICMP 18708]APQ03280.1 hypothetical protein PsaNZ47_11395 [Pseudomonas syringae pv. actinidiae]OKS58051.1 hypothetical protein PsaNZ62_08110 [Pseudomonas syringae pv. actinidiae]